MLGFGKVLDMEHAEYSAVLVDVDAESDERAARAIVTEMQQPAKEKQVAYRRSNRLVAVWRVVALPRRVCQFRRHQAV
ncbi:MAG: hypothetical protein R3F38_00510 [Gammaproteobacteria bacterium]